MLFAGFLRRFLPQRFIFRSTKHICETFMTEDLPASFYTVSNLLQKRKTEPKNTRLPWTPVSIKLCAKRIQIISLSVILFWKFSSRHSSILSPLFLLLCAWTHRRWSSDWWEEAASSAAFPEPHAHRGHSEPWRRPASTVITPYITDFPLTFRSQEENQWEKWANFPGPVSLLAFSGTYGRAMKTPKGLSCFHIMGPTSLFSRCWQSLIVNFRYFSGNCTSWTWRVSPLNMSKSCCLALLWSLLCSTSQPTSRSYSVKSVNPRAAQWAVNSTIGAQNATQAIKITEFAKITKKCAGFCFIVVFCGQLVLT